MIADVLLEIRYCRNAHITSIHYNFKTAWIEDECADTTLDENCIVLEPISNV